MMECAEMTGAGWRKTMKVIIVGLIKIFMCGT